MKVTSKSTQPLDTAVLCLYPRQTMTGFHLVQSHLNSETQYGLLGHAHTSC